MRFFQKQLIFAHLVATSISPSDNACLGTRRNSWKSNEALGYLETSPFQLNVWNALQTIPYGKTISYLELAHQIGDKNAVRAVASANGANALALIVPCHRVIGSTNKLVGYAGGLSSKKKLLQLELTQSHNPSELPFWESETS